MFAVKICGITSRASLDLCVRAGADALGFVFARSPARIDVTRARALACYVPRDILRVGVFAANPAAMVCAAIDALSLDVLQFCGNEDLAFRASFGLPTLHVVGIDPHRRTAIALPQPEELQRERAMALLVDVRRNGVAGGSGVRVDSAWARRVGGASTLPLVLAGGLTPFNVAAAIGRVRPAAVDVRSGVEHNGCKDEVLTALFVREARAAFSRLAHDRA
jgi:phosphoribosylanthranilate isomerase